MEVVVREKAFLELSLLWFWRRKPPVRIEVSTQIVIQLNEVAELHLLHCHKDCVEVKLPQSLNEGQSFQKHNLFQTAELYLLWVAIADGAENTWHLRKVYFAEQQKNDDNTM